MPAGLMKVDMSTVVATSESVDCESASATLAIDTDSGATAAPRERIADAARIPALDGLRGVASLMVVVYHFGPNILRDGGGFQFLHSLPPSGLRVWICSSFSQDS
jgi:hypothetical protein